MRPSGVPAIIAFSKSLPMMPALCVPSVSTPPGDSVDSDFSRPQLGREPTRNRIDRAFGPGVDRGLGQSALAIDVNTVRPHRFGVLYIAEAASITGGASRANMALASASERIRTMEEALGVPLLERKRRGVELAPAGSALERHARIVMQQLEEMRGELNNYAKGLRGHVHVLSNTVAMVEFLPAALGVFLSAHPNIDLEERQSGEIIRAIADGLADIGIVAEPVDPAEELETFPFAEDRLVVIAPHRHALAQRREIAFREILDHDFVGLVAGSALQRTLNHHAARVDRRLKLRVRLNSFDSIARMVESGIGLAVLPETVARRCQRSMAIRVIALKDAWAPRHFTICVQNLKSLSAHAQWLVEYMRRHSPARQ
jgi:DNA-binding transcriptional LysR family regulator